MVNLDKGVCFWFTGFAASGKSTIAGEVQKTLLGRGIRIENLDADEIRANISPDLKYTPADRDLNTKRLAWISGFTSPLSGRPTISSPSDTSATRRFL